MAENATPNSGEPDHPLSGSTPSPAKTDYRHPRWPRGSVGYLVRGSRAIESRTAQHATFRIPHSIVVVGVCSAGKSTLVRNLSEKGYKARAVAQEHSYVPQLWQRSKPDVLIYLDASLHTIRQRGRSRWRQTVLDVEHGRLLHAREHCDLYVFTDGLSPDDVTSRVVTFLTNRVNAEDGVRSAE